VITIFCATSLFSLNRISLSKWNLAAVVVLMIFLYVVNKLVRRMSLQIGDADFGISNTTYFGQSLKAPLILTLSVVFIGLILGCTNALNSKKAQAPKTINEHSFKLWNLTQSSKIFVVLAYCLITAINVSSIVQNQISSYGSNLSFDFLNFATWQKFHESGLRAMKDFWYPYGGMIWFQDSRVGPIFVLVSILILSMCILFPVLENKKINILQIIIFICLNYLISIDWFNALRYAFPFVSMLVFIKKSNSRLIQIVMSLPLSVVWWLSPEVAVLCLALFAVELSRVSLTIRRFKTKTKEHLERNAKAKMKSILHIETGIIYESRNAAALAAGVGPSAIQRRAKKGLYKYLGKTYNFKQNADIYYK
jgi:hypothetical protein